MAPQAAIDLWLETYGDYSFWHELDRAAAVEVPEPVSGEDLLIMLYTSGTTGSPKGVEVPVKSLASFQAYMEFGLDLREDDMYWNMADPGWAYGLYYNLVGPLLVGKATFFYGGAFSPEGIFRILNKYRVTNFASAPTAYRALKAGIAGDDDLSDELKAFVKKHLAAHQYPREIDFVDQLPKTPSGKSQRFLLRKS